MEEKKGEKEIVSETKSKRREEEAEEEEKAPLEPLSHCHETCLCLLQQELSL